MTNDRTRRPTRNRMASSSERRDYWERRPRRYIFIFSVISDNLKAEFHYYTFEEAPFYSNLPIKLKSLTYCDVISQGMRYYKSIGLGFKTPKEAIEGSYVDKKCPFTGNVSIRGRILKAMVISTKMKRTVVIRRDYLQYVSKYRRFEKRHKNVSVHCSPCFLNVREGDVVTVGQCRPLAKTVRFNVLEHQPSVNKVRQL